MAVIDNMDFFTKVFGAEEDRLLVLQMLDNLANADLRLGYLAERYYISLYTPNPIYTFKPTSFHMGTRVDLIHYKLVYYEQ